MSSALVMQDVLFRREHGFTLRVPELRLAAGETALLSGGSGSGKSTLLWVIAGLLRAESGRIEIAGERLDALPESGRDRLRARRIGLVFQTHHLLPEFTAAENVALALMAAGEPERSHLPRARDLLRLARADAQAWIERDPDLRAQESTLLRRKLLATHGEALGLADVG